MFFIYLGISDLAVSAVLLREENRVQRPIYYISHALKGAEVRYPTPEKTAYAVVLAARKLRPYFQTSAITVLTNQPLLQILHKPGSSGRLLKWTIELSEYEIYYAPRRAIKIQALADFIVECTVSSPGGEGSEQPFEWVLFFDGSSCKTGTGAGVVILGPDDFKCEYALRFNFKATNNMAEYEALLLGLKIAKELKVQDLLVKSDSQLVVSQIDGTYSAKDEVMAKYLSLVNNITATFNRCTVEKVARVDNELADVLSKRASSSRCIFTKVLDEPNIMPPQLMTITEPAASPCWMDEIILYLTEQYQPTSSKDAVRIARKSARFHYKDGELCKRSYTLPYAKCLNPVQAEQILRTLHEHIGGGHYG